jgi:flavin reductase (DIM6/NTAB) family NADH-FMN oxidoreductase RutF
MFSAELASRNETIIMTMSWHMVMGFEPSLVGCHIWDQNHSFEMTHKGRECVINIPTYEPSTKSWEAKLATDKSPIGSKIYRGTLSVLGYCQL